MFNIYRVEYFGDTGKNNTKVYSHDRVGFPVISVTSILQVDIVILQIKFEFSSQIQSFFWVYQSQGSNAMHSSFSQIHHDGAVQAIYSISPQHHRHNNIPKKSNAEAIGDIMQQHTFLQTAHHVVSIIRSIPSTIPFKSTLTTSLALGLFAVLEQNNTAQGD
jgi:hypothetical protein